tara:strand:+ start:1085 stop:1726 length:642 start_codon:yes stop_codon:yes gene_type:complete
MSKKIIKNEEDLSPAEKNIRKRYRNAKGQLISYQDAQNIKNYWRELIPQDKKPDNYNDPNFLRITLKNLQPDELRQFSSQGNKGFTKEIPEMFLVDSALPITVETTVDMRLNQAEAEGTKLFYKDQRVSKKELLAILQEFSDDIKELTILEGLNWYKTYATLQVDYKNNKITFDDDGDQTAGNPVLDPRNRRYIESQKLNKEQKEWLKNRDKK